MERICIIDERLPLGHNLTMVAKTFFGAFTKFMEHHEIEKYFTILMLLESAGEPYNQQALADSLKLDKVSMVRILDYLDTRKLVSRVTNPEDRREKYVELTEYAKTRMQLIRSNVAEMNDSAFEGVSPGDRETFFRVLKSLNKTLNQMPANFVIVNFKKKKNHHG